VQGLQSAADFARLTDELEARLMRSSAELYAPDGAARRGFRGDMQLIDSMSNDVCALVDAAELCRNVHPRAEWVAAANACYQRGLEMLMRLNTDARLLPKLRELQTHAARSPDTTEEERRILQSFELDLRVTGYHLPMQTRTEVHNIQRRIDALQMEYLQNLAGASVQATVSPASALKSLPAGFDAYVALGHAAGAGRVQVSVDESFLNAALKYVRDEGVRRELFRAFYGSHMSSRNAALLEDLANLRAKWARLVGFETFAHMNTQRGMIHSPERARAFLETLASRLRGAVQHELRMMVADKAQAGAVDPRNVHAWDTAFLMGRIKSSTFDLDAHAISEYFSVDNVLRGLQLVAHSALGVDLTPSPWASPFESWHPDVRRMEVRDSGTRELLGVLYLDLFGRAGKAVGEVSYLVQSSFARPDGSRQPARVAIVCHVPPPSQFSKGPPRLLLSQVEALFHEFGHAMHACLSRTTYQALAGARGPLDFVEIPSHLMEYFASDYRVQREFALHFRTGEPLPAAVAERLARSRSLFAPTAIANQIVLALFDLELHSRRARHEHDGDGVPAHAPESSATLLQRLNSKYLLRELPQNTFWQGHFGHCCHYAASYYSYLHCRSVASQMWHTHFATDPLSGPTSRQYRQMVLASGSARDPRVVVREFLQHEPTVEHFVRESLPAYAQEAAYDSA
jgi:intermediate peptidase